MKTRASIKFGLIDVTAKNDSTLTVNNKMEFVDLEDLKRDDLEEIKYGTCEQNLFVLDGTFELVSKIDTLQDMGWWSNEISGETGIFNTPLILEINFTELHSSMGLTFIFSKTGDYCNNLNIKYYNSSNELLANLNFNPDEYRYVCNGIVENYSKIIITFYSTNHPYRYLKLYKILYGAEILFEGSNLLNANLLEEIDLLSSEISINTLDFQVFSKSDDFNILNPQGVYKLLQQRQKLEVTEFMLKDGLKLNMGTFYLDTWSNERERIMKFGAIDLIGVIDKTDFKGGMYENIRFESLINEIMTSAGVENVEYTIQEDLKDVLLSGYIPICSHRSALQQVLFVTGAVTDCSRSNQIKIYTIQDTEINSSIGKNRIFQGTKKIEQNELVTGIEVVAHQFLKSTQEEQLYAGTMNSGTIKIIFDEPVYDISCIGATIIESNCNYAIVSCNSTSDIVIKGYKYKDSLRSYLIELPGLNLKQKQNTLKVESAYLIHNGNALNIGNRILDYYQKTYNVAFTYVLTDGTMAKRIEIQTDFNHKLDGHIIKLDVDLTGGFIANTTVYAKVKEDDMNVETTDI